MQVSFIIPVFNQLAHTRACLASLREHVPTEVEHELIMVDDGSDSETRDFLASQGKAIRLVRHDSNQGYARSTNDGAAVASGRWLCLLNNDVELTAGALQSMLAVREQEPTAGIIGNIQITSDTGEVDHAGIDFRDGGYPLHRRGELTTLQAAGEIVAIPAVTAACCLVDRPWFVATGGLDESYRNGFEDVDLCLRARENGWGVFVATRSVVRHAVSVSQGRGRHEFRNAQRFLDRWGPRTAAIEKAERVAAARQHQVARAQANSPPNIPAAVRTARERVLAREADRIQRANTPATVWVDLLRMAPGGANGGIKPFVFSFLREMSTLRWQALRYVIFVREEVAAEIDWLRSEDDLAVQTASGWSWRGESHSSLSPVETSRPPEVLYAPFATSSLAKPGLPYVALMVDTLHRDLPSALPIEEVNFREDWFKRVLGSSTWLQCNSRHVMQQLQTHWNVHPSRCFYTYNAVHERLPAASEPRAAGRTFFYPANFWPHKNHEVLLTAYRRYRHAARENAWNLVLTGHPDERMKTLQEMATSLGLDDGVQFRGHVPSEEFARLWHEAGALVFPSQHEGFGIPLVEAFHHGVPVLAARATALPEVAGDAVAWFDPRDPRALANAMRELAEDAALRDDLTRRGRERLQRFSLHYEACRLNHFLHAAARGLVP